MFDFLGTFTVTQLNSFNEQVLVNAQAELDRRIKWLDKKIYDIDQLYLFEAEQAYNKYNITISWVDKSAQITDLSNPPIRFNELDPAIQVSKLKEPLIKDIKTLERIEQKLYRLKFRKEQMINTKKNFGILMNNINNILTELDSQTKDGLHPSITVDDLVEGLDGNLLNSKQG